MSIRLEKIGKLFSQLISTEVLNLKGEDVLIMVVILGSNASACSSAIALFDEARISDDGKKGNRSVRLTVRAKPSISNSEFNKLLFP